MPSKRHLERRLISVFLKHKFSQCQNNITLQKMLITCNISVIPMTWKGLKQHNLTPQETRKRTTKPKVSRRKGITKIRVEVNEIEVRKTTEKMNETGFF